MIMMATGRFLTNYAYQLWGKKKVLQLAGSFICIGFFISALLGGVFESMAMKVIINSLGFMLVGLGISCIVPTLYSFVGAKIKNTGQYCTYHSVKYQFYRFVDCSPAYRCHLAGVRYPYRLYDYRHIGWMYRINSQFQ